MASQKETLLIKFLVSKREAIASFSSIDKALVALKDAATWAQANLSEVADEAKKAAFEVKRSLAEQERAFRRLGITGDATARQIKQSALDAHKQILASELSSERERKESWERLRSTIRRVNERIGKYSDSTHRQMMQDSRKFGILSEAEANKTKKEWAEAFARMQASGRFSTTDIANAHRSMAAEIAAINKRVYGEVEADGDRMARELRESWARIGVASDASAREQRRNMQEAYDRIVADSNSTSADIRRARAALNAFLHQQDEAMGRSFRSELRQMQAAAARFSAVSAALIRRSTRSGSRFLFGEIQGFNLLGRAAHAASSLIRGAQSIITGAISAITSVIEKLVSITTKIGVIGAASWGVFTASAASAAAALAKHVGTIAGDFERMDTAMKSVVKEDYDQAKKFITGFAKVVTFSEQEITESFLKLRNFGYNQEQAEMAQRAITEQTAMIGGSADDMLGISLAFGQAFTKQKFMAEEALQLAERNVPIWDLLGEVTGKTGKQLQQFVTAGKAGRQEILAVIDLMGQRASGAAAAQMATYSGQVIQLDKAWKNLMRNIGQAGVLESLGAVIKRVIAYLEDTKTMALFKRFAEIGVDVFDRLATGAMWFADVFGHRVADFLEQSIKNLTLILSYFFNGLDRNWDLVISTITNIVGAFEAFIFVIGQRLPDVLAVVNRWFGWLFQSILDLNEAAKSSRFQRFLELMGLVIGRVAKAAKDWISSINPDKVVGGMMALGTAVFTVMNAVANLVSSEAGKEWARSLGDIFVWLGSTAMQLSKDFAELLRNGFGGAQLEMPIMQKIQGFVNNDLPGLIDALASAGDAFVWLVGAARDAANWFTGLSDAGKVLVATLAALPFVASAISALFSVFSAGYAILAAIVKIGALLIATIGGVPAAIAVAVVAAGVLIWAYWDEISTFFTETVGGWISKLGDFFGWVANGVGETLYSAVSGIIDWVAGLISSAIDAVTGFLGSVRDKLASLMPDWIKNLFGGSASVTVNGDQVETGSKGFMSGGYTGNGPRTERAGHVHKGEWVLPQPVVQRLGIPFLEALTDGLLPQAMIPAVTLANVGPSGGEYGARMSLDLIGLGGRPIQLEGASDQLSRLNRELVHRRSTYNKKPRGSR